MRVYLGGRINGAIDKEVHGWREEVKKVLVDRGDTWCDPSDRDYRGREMESGVASEIVKSDLQDLVACDVAFMNCSTPSWGTAMEIAYAFQLGIPAIAVLPHGQEPSPWLMYHCRVAYGAPATVALVTEWDHLARGIA